MLFSGPSRGVIYLDTGTLQDHTVAYLPPGSLSTLEKPVSHFQKKNQWGSDFGHFFYKRLKKGQKIFPGAFGARVFADPPGRGGLRPKNQSVTFEKPVTHPQGEGYAQG